MSRYLGQHFLINKSKLNKIVEALELKDNDVVIEIGPGHGEITREIGEREKGKGIMIIAIEKDIALAQNLEFRIKDLGIKNIEIIKGDSLKIIPNLPKTFNLKPSTYKVVGNIPYYITGYLLRILGDLKKKPSLIVLTIQKEVAERICAKAGSMNLLAASVQFWAKPEIIDYVSKKDFRPSPKVDSAIVRLMPHKITNYQLPITNYYKFIKILFKQPRKTIFNNLRPMTNNQQFLFEKLKKAGVDPNARPQDLSIEQIIKLSEIFSQIASEK